MGVEFVGVLGIVLALVVFAARLVVPGRERRRVPARAAVSPEDQLLVRVLGLTSAQWLALTNSQRSDLREQAFRKLH